MSETTELALDVARLVMVLAGIFLYVGAVAVGWGHGDYRLAFHLLIAAIGLQSCERLLGKHFDTPFEA